MPDCGNGSAGANDYQAGEVGGQCAGKVQCAHPCTQPRPGLPCFLIMLCRAAPPPAALEGPKQRPWHRRVPGSLAGRRGDGRGWGRHLARNLNSRDPAAFPSNPDFPDFGIRLQRRLRRAVAQRLFLRPGYPGFFSTWARCVSRELIRAWSGRLIQRGRSGERRNVLEKKRLNRGGGEPSSSRKVGPKSDP